MGVERMIYDGQECDMQASKASVVEYDYCMVWLI